MINMSVSLVVLILGIYYSQFANCDDQDLYLWKQDVSWQDFYHILGASNKSGDIIIYEDQLTAFNVNGHSAINGSVLWRQEFSIAVQGFSSQWLCKDVLVVSNLANTNITLALIDPSTGVITKTIVTEFSYLTDELNFSYYGIYFITSPMSSTPTIHWYSCDFELILSVKLSGLETEPLYNFVGSEDPTDPLVFFTYAVNAQTQASDVSMFVINTDGQFKGMTLDYNVSNLVIMTGIVNRNVVYTTTFLNQTNEIISINIDTFTLNWRVPNTAATNVPFFVTNDQKILLAVYAFPLFALDTSTGSTLWTNNDIVCMSIFYIGDQLWGACSDSPTPFNAKIDTATGDLVVSEYFNAPVIYTFPSAYLNGLNQIAAAGEAGTQVDNWIGVVNVTAWDEQS